jgi:predicted CoA-binding protein
MKVVILGASQKPHRFSYKALMALEGIEAEVVLVHPVLESIEGRAVVRSLGDVGADVDTVTVYVNAAVSSGLVSEFLALSPRRVVFNPGAENPELEEVLKDVGIEVVNYCTLIMVSEGTF